MADSDFENIQNAFSASYAPFSLKIEDPSIFVGFRHSVDITAEGKSCINFTIDTRNQFERNSSKIPRFTHAQSNMPKSQIVAIFKGSIIRCIDCSSTETLCFESIMRTADEFKFVGFSMKSFCSVLRAVSKQYEFLTPLAQIFSNRHKLAT